MDQTRHHQQICEYADDAFSARSQALQDVDYLQNHPNAIDCILEEGDLFNSIMR